MKDTPHVSLEQWRALIAVVEAGGYAQAAGKLHKSQSAITYAVQKIESQLELKLFTVQGRRALLTEAGHLLYRRARTLVEEALALERGSEGLREGWKPELRIAAEIIFPTRLLLDALGVFARERPETHVELYETVMDGTSEMLTQGRVDLAICSHLPKGFLGDPLLQVRFVCAAHPDHPLHQLGRTLTRRNLSRHRHLFIRDTSSERQRDARTLDSGPRWTVSHKATSIEAACLGQGYAWYAEEDIREAMEQGLLKPLPLREGSVRTAQLMLAFADADYAGRDEHRLAELLRERIARCPGELGVGEKSEKVLKDSKRLRPKAKGRI